MLKNIDVFILCGGLGNRLKEISHSTPKPMVKFGERHFLDIIINYMAGFGFKRFILGVGYNANYIINYYENHKIPNLNMLFCKEETPLDTGGAVKNARQLIKSDIFFVLNGDSFCKFNPSGFLKFHNKNKSSISILLKKVSNGEDYGEVKIDNFSHIVGFNEKDSEAKECFINSGIYIFNKKVFNLMPDVPRFSLERNLFPALIGKGIFGYPTSGYFIDIGTPQMYYKAEKYFKRNH